MTDSLMLISARVDGIPGPKGSTKSWCVRCKVLHLPQKINTVEESEVGIRFRKLVARSVKTWLIKNRVNEIFVGPVYTRFTFYIVRKRVVKNGVETAEWWPSHSGIVPMDRNSGDVEKHIRTVHDAFKDAGLIADDAQVSDTSARKRWATAEHPAGVVIEVREMTEEML